MSKEIYQKISDKIYEALTNAGFYGDELDSQARAMTNSLYKQYLKEKKEENDLKEEERENE